MSLMSGKTRFGQVKYLSFILRGRSSTKAEGRPRSRKNVGHHGWPTKKSLGFEWPLNGSNGFEVFVFFSGTFLNMFRVFLVRQNNFWDLFSFHKSFFHKNPKNQERFGSK